MFGKITPRLGSKAVKRTVIVALIILAFTGGYKLRPRLTAENLVAVYGKYVLLLPSHKEALKDNVLETVMKTDYRALIGIHTAADVAARRKAAADYIFRGLPGALEQRPNRVETNVLFLPLADLNNLAGIDRLTVTMPYGIESIIFHLRPRFDQSCLMIYQEGHRVSFVARKLFLKRVLGEGCHILALSLPLTGGINNRPEIDHPRFGRILLNDPDDLEFLDSEKNSSLQYFITPLIAALNHALDGRSFSRIGATGFSGGGWAVEILAALDPRIKASYAAMGQPRATPSPLL